MMRPIVNGMERETLEDTTRSERAARSTLVSGRASSISRRTSPSCTFFLGFVTGSRSSALATAGVALLGAETVVLGRTRAHRAGIGVGSSRRGGRSARGDARLDPKAR